MVPWGEVMFLVKLICMITLKSNQSLEVNVWKRLEIFRIVIIRTMINTNAPYYCLDGNSPGILWQNYDYLRIYNDMLKPAFAFDGRRLLDTTQLENFGFHVEVIGRKSWRNGILPVTP